MRAFDLSIPTPKTWNLVGNAPFSRVKDAWGIFSNMANHHGYEDGGLPWGSTEAQYQAARFPHLPEHQRAILRAPHAMAAKMVAYERVEETRPDWQGVKVAMMAYVLTRKLDASDAFRQELERAAGLDIIEISSRDALWGAKPLGATATGSNLLGTLQMQLRDGARLDVLPIGTTFPVPATPDVTPDARFLKPRQRTLPMFS